MCQGLVRDLSIPSIFFFFYNFPKLSFFPCSLFTSAVTPRALTFQTFLQLFRLDRTHCPVGFTFTRRFQCCSWSVIIGFFFFCFEKFFFFVQSYSLRPPTRFCHSLLPYCHSKNNILRVLFRLIFIFSLFFFLSSFLRTPLLSFNNSLRPFLPFFFFFYRNSTT